MAQPFALRPGHGAVLARRIEPPDSLDYFPTPPWAVHAFWRLLQERGLASRHHVAWDPACGQGHMAGPMQEFFADVVATDIFDHGGVRELHPPAWAGELDFLDDQQPAFRPVDWIITNPPFNAALQFVLRAITTARVGVAMLVRTPWLATEARYFQLFARQPPSFIVQYVERVPMHRGRWLPYGDTATDYVWVVWHKGGGRPPSRDPAYLWLPPGQRKALMTQADIRRFAWEEPLPLLEMLAPIEGLSA